MKQPKETNQIDFKTFKKQVLNDYKLVFSSRACSVLGRREVLSGKGTFGIFGDGKELPQIAINRFFQNGDFRSGYYRDQTLLMAQGFLDSNAFFYSLYTDTEPGRETMSGGRQMCGHFMTPLVDENKAWLDHTKRKNHIADLSPTAAQIPRILGLAQASKLYRTLNIKGAAQFSKDGNEICWGTIGNASTSEGLFFETINAAGVLQVPMVLSVYDDGYGISVHNEQQTTKASISKALEGFQRNENQNGIEILEVKGWDYAALINTYEHAAKLARTAHIPVVVHVTELTQPLGHSTSGSHQRYKSKARLEWEKEYDCNVQFRNWILAQGIATEEEVEALEKTINMEVREAKTTAWAAVNKPINEAKAQLHQVLHKVLAASNNNVQVRQALTQLDALSTCTYRELLQLARTVLPAIASTPARTPLKEWYNATKTALSPRFSDELYTQEFSTLTRDDIPPTYPDQVEKVDGRVLLRDNFEALFSAHDNLIVFGEDVGTIGDVNQGLEGLQEKFGPERIADTGIREATIFGQGMGMALRGLRPIAEIQYLDYILYCLQGLSDDLASLSYRTKGKQICPLIIRTRGHRLEGIWHSGSPMGGLLSLLRGIYILTPRNMTQAAGMYNALLQQKQPAVLIESLNGYRLKESLPSNLGAFTVALGTSECTRAGSDLTIVSYGSTFRLAEAAAEKLAQYEIDVELIDLRSLLPFDLTQNIAKSVQKTNRLLIVDEDVPGGASAYILQQLIETQDLYHHLDSAPKLLSAAPHRPAAGPDGDYFSKPSIEDIFEAAYAMLHEANPDNYPNYLD